jgi:adenine-specific DNA-methyltransferase
VLLDEEQASRWLTVSARVSDECVAEVGNGLLASALEQRKATMLREVSERNAAFFEAEANKIDSWADDLKVGLEREIKEYDSQIKEARRSAVAALTLEEKLEVQKQVRHLESQRNTKRRALFEAQDEIDSKREILISEIEGKLQRKDFLNQLFQIRWHVK